MYSIKLRWVYAKFGDKSLFSGTLIVSFGRSRISMTHAKLNAKKVPFETAHAGNSVDQLSTPTRKITPRSPHISPEPIRWRAGLAPAVANSCLGGFPKNSHELCLLTVGYGGVCCVSSVKKFRELIWITAKEPFCLYVWFKSLYGILSWKKQQNFRWVLYCKRKEKHANNLV